MNSDLEKKIQQLEAELTATKLRSFPEPYGILTAEFVPEVVWITTFKENGKRRTTLSWDGQITPYYRKFVDAKSLEKAEAEIKRLRKELEFYKTNALNRE